MNTDKSIVLKAFNKQFFEFIDDIISVFPDNVEMLTARDAFLTFKNMNPTILAKVWYSGVYIPYKEQIETGDIDFFTEKDYTSDVGGSPNEKSTQNVLNMIDKVRDPIKNMTRQSKDQVHKYIQNLTKLSIAYSKL